MGGKLRKKLTLPGLKVIRRSFAAAALVLAAPLLSPATALAQASKDKPTPATAMEVNTYGVMSIATFCEARAQKIEFNKSLAVAGVGLSLGA